MATQLTLRKGTKIQNDAFTGAEGELTYVSDTKGLRLHDGSTQGGMDVDVVVEFVKPTAENNYTWARKYASGWVEQGGIINIAVSVTNAMAIFSVNLPVEMGDTNYTGFCQARFDGGSAWNGPCLNTGSSTTTVAKFEAWASGSATVTAKAWQVSGMAA